MSPEFSRGMHTDWTLGPDRLDAEGVKKENHRKRNILWKIIMSTLIKKNPPPIGPRKALSVLER